MPASVHSTRSSLSTSSWFSRSQPAATAVRDNNNERADAPLPVSNVTNHSNRPRKLQKPSSHRPREEAVMRRGGFKAATAANQPPVPPSPTLTATTSTTIYRNEWHNNSGNDQVPDVICTRADLRASVAAYEGLLAAAKQYRNATVAMSAASIEMAGALEACARVKGAYQSAEPLMAASGVHYMIANSGQVLSDMLYRSFEIPLMHAFDAYVVTGSNRHAEYEQLLAEKTAAIRQTEAENLRQGRQKSRDLQQFRKALERLQDQVRQVEQTKQSYYLEVLEHELDTWSTIENKVSLLTRSTLDLADRLASKATSDAVVEQMLNEHPDPFDSFRNEGEAMRGGNGDVFTVLPPLGMNLGLGGSSKKGSVIDLDKAEQREALATAGDDEESETSDLEQATSGRTPRGTIKAKTPGEVLGISTAATMTDEQAVAQASQDDDENGGAADQDDTPRRRQGSHHSVDRAASSTRRQLQASGASTVKDCSPTPLRIKPSVREDAHLSASPLKPKTPIKKKLRDAFKNNRSCDGGGSTTVSRDVDEGEDEVAHSATESLDEHRNPFRSPRKSKTSSSSAEQQRQNRRSLSRVTEVEQQQVDPMAGDWSIDYNDVASRVGTTSLHDAAGVIDESRAHSVGYDDDDVNWE
ncbi:hypothetical protein ACM66B_005655 [Microbotryomycetes sp. NB124-2]